METVYVTIGIPKWLWDSIQSSMENKVSEWYVNTDSFCGRTIWTPNGYNIALELPARNILPQTPIPRISESISPLLTNPLPLSPSPSSKLSPLDAVKEWIYNPNRNEAEPISTTELSELLGITKASVTRSINKLCKSNLVEFEIVYIGKENKMLLKTTEPF